MIRGSNLRNFILPALLIASLLIASCGEPAPPAPAPTPTHQADAVVAADTPAAQPAKPTVAATAPTTAPLDLPPVAVETMPRRGEEQPLDAPIVVRFDQPMDEASTLAAFAIEPAVEGDVAVDGAELTFQPAADALARGESYRVTVNQDAQSSSGKMLAAPVDLRFNAVGFLEVTSTQPGDGNEEVAVDAPITVVFNRPVVPLTSIDGQADLPQPLEISPATEGAGEWLNTSIYMFHPAEPLAGDATYRVTVPAGLTDVKGSLLAEDVEFFFTTALPVVESILPEGPMVKPTTVVTVTFSQPMDQQSAKDATVLRHASDKQAVAGRTRWLNGDRVLVFEPLTDLEFATAYLIEVAETARTATGSGTLRSPFTGQFATAPKLALLRTEPADGAKNTSVEGQFVAAFEGIVDEKTLGADAFTIIPKPTDVYSYFNQYENRWQISWPRQPQTDYTLTLAADISDIFGNELGEQTVRFQTGDRKPFAHLNVPNDLGTYDAYAPTEIAASYRNVSSLDFKLYELNETQAERLLGPNRYDAMNQMQPAADSLLREWSVPVTPEANTNNLIKVPLAEDGGALPSGIYWLEMRAPEVKYGDGSQESGQQPARHLLIVSPLNLLAKRTATEVLVWATDLQSGQPVIGLPVRASGDVDAAGVTDAEGIARLAATNREPWQPLTVFAGDPDEEATGDAPQTYGVMSTEWQTGLGPWDYNLPGEFPPPTSQGYIYTDRPIYRPGQTVYWKGILRSDDDAIYTPPPQGTKYNVAIRNFQGEEVYNAVHETNAFGTIDGALPLDEEAGLGFYYLEIMPANSPADAYYVPAYGVNFQVAEYRKPEFEATLTTDKDEVLGGDTIEATMAAEFFFGGAVSDAKVTWTAFTQDTSFDYQSEDGRWYSFYDYTGWDPLATNQYGGLVASGEGKTGRDGSYTFDVPADISDKLNSQVFTIDARLTDLNNQEVAQNTSVMVHKGLVYPGVAPRSYVAAVGQPLETDLITVDWDGNPVADTDLEIVVSLAEWKNVQKKASDGQFYWASEVKETPILTDTVTTDADGEAVFTWTPETGGQYKIKAIATDELGNEVRSSAFIWAGESGSDYVPWPIDNNDRIELVADKPLYQVGDTAKVLVPHPFSGPVEALLTIERGEIIETQLLTIDGNSETLEIPITEEHVPNIFVSVALVKGADAASDALGSFKLGYAMLPVDPVVKELNVKLTASQSQLKPGDTVTFAVEVTDNAGNPVETELSLALVDKALLALASEQQGTLMDTFYRQRGLGVQTASTLVYNLNRINLQLQEGAKGGGGGGDGMMGAEVRSEFQDAALWEPTLVTDAQGRGEVTVTLPDNLTTWRLDGRAVTVDTKVGQATIEVQTSLPLLVRPVLPRFFTAGDKAEISAIVNNNTEEDRTVEVTLASEAVTTDQPLSQIVAVPARGQTKVSWPVDVPAPDGGLATTPGVIRFSAQETAGAAPLADAVEITVPIQRYSSPETTATAGTVAQDEERTEVIVLPSDVDPTQGELRVQLDPSLAAGMIASLDWLQTFPYDCNEQIISKFLGNVVTYEALQGLGVENPVMTTQLEKEVARAVQKLQRRQNLDGGWGWWGNEQSSPFTSTYVVYGLLRAQSAGFGIDQTTLDRGLDYLTLQLQPVTSAQGWELNQQSFILYVLALGGQGDTGRTVALYDVRERLAYYGEAWLALAFEQLRDAGETTAQARIDSLVDDLLGSAVVSATGAHWEETSPDRQTMNTDTRSTALALDVLARLDPNALKGIAPNAVRWLMVDRQDGIWSTTQENVWSIVALTDWMLATGELEGDYSYSVALNESEVDNGVVTPENVDEPVELRIAVRDMLLDHANALTISRFAEGNQSGDGQLYYTAYLNYFLPAASLEAMDRGIVVARQVSRVDPLTGKVVEQNVSQAAIGDTLLVTVTLVAPTNLNYLIVESPLPAGAEAIDPSLLTTSLVYEEPGLQPSDPSRGVWWWTPTSTELRDEKVVMFATDLPAGTYQYIYQMRASLPGQFQVLPTVASQMYFPEVWGRSAGDLFAITETANQ